MAVAADDMPAGAIAMIEPVEMGRIPDSAVRVRNLRKRYEPIVALDGIDLDIARGEVFALLGPNGAGKTTAVEILEGHRDRDAGEVEVLGEDPAGAGREWRSRIGIVLQTAYDTAELTVAESVRHFARYYPARVTRTRRSQRWAWPAGRTAGSATCHPACAAASTSRSASSAPRSCSSWTNRRPGSIPRPASSSGSS